MTDQATIDLSVMIKASAGIVWDALTQSDKIGCWISNEPVEIISEWYVGAAIMFRGTFHDMAFENRGQIEVFEPLKVLQYSHWSSLSVGVLDDRPENRALIRFVLTPEAERVRLDLTLGRFAHETIRPHLALYWGATLPLIKQVCENDVLHEAVKLPA